MLAAISTPAWPSEATCTSYPSCLRVKTRTRWMFRSSSTTRTLWQPCKTLDVGIGPIISAKTGCIHAPMVLVQPGSARGSRAPDADTSGSATTASACPAPSTMKSSFGSPAASNSATLWRQLISRSAFGAMSRSAFGAIRRDGSDRVDEPRARPKRGRPDDPGAPIPATDSRPRPSGSRPDGCSSANAASATTASTGRSGADDDGDRGAHADPTRAIGPSPRSEEGDGRRDVQALVDAQRDDARAALAVPP